MRVLLIAVTLLAACTDEDLQRTCPVPEPCFTDAEGTVHTDMDGAPFRIRFGETYCTDPEADLQCVGEIKPEPETCDGVDNDGDGAVDEALTRSFADVEYTCDYDNPCARQERCVKGEWLCVPADNYGTSEVCDGLDNDCNGEVDEGLDEPRFDYPYEEHPGTLGVGECRAAVEYCLDGVVHYVEPILPTAETCFDGKDNDCNGQTDELLNMTTQALTLVVDKSGSMMEEIVAITAAVCQASADPVASSLTDVRLVWVGEGSVYPWVSNPTPWMTLSEACAELSVAHLGGGTEYMIEGGLLGAVNWSPNGSIRRQIWLTDEEVQIAENSAQRMFDACTTMNFRVDVVTTVALSWQWTPIASACGGTVTTLPSVSTPQSLIDTFVSVLAEGC